MELKYSDKYGSHLYYTNYYLYYLYHTDYLGSTFGFQVKDAKNNRFETGRHHEFQQAIEIFRLEHTVQV